MGVIKTKFGKPTMFLFCFSLLVNISRSRFLLPLSPQMAHHRLEFIRFTKASNLNLLLTFVVPL